MSLGATRWKLSLEYCCQRYFRHHRRSNFGTGRTRGNDGSDDGNWPHRRLAVHYLNWVTPSHVLANEFGEAQDELHLGSLMYLALILFVVTAG